MPRDCCNRLAESEEDPLEHRTDGSDAFVLSVIAFGALLAKKPLRPRLTPAD